MRRLWKPPDVYMRCLCWETSADVMPGSFISDRSSPNYGMRFGCAKCGAGYTVHPQWGFPPSGAYQVREAFLWWPKTIHGETRWLERARWEEKCIYSDRGEDYRWEPVVWL